MLFARSTKELDPAMAFIVEHRLIGIGIVVVLMLMRMVTAAYWNRQYYSRDMSPMASSFVWCFLIGSLGFLLNTYRFY